MESDLTKEKGFVLSFLVINLGELTRKYGGAKEDKGYFRKVHLCRLILVSTLHLQ